MSLSSMISQIFLPPLSYGILGLKLSLKGFLEKPHVPRTTVAAPPQSSFTFCILHRLIFLLPNIQESKSTFISENVMTAWLCDSL